MIKKEKVIVSAISLLLLLQVFMGVTPNVAADDTVFIIGTSSLAIDLDPHMMWDSASWDMARHVAEGLLGYDPYDPDFALIPKLATSLGTWSNGNLNYTLNLREGVYFHDGTEFNAAAVKWNFDRLSAFIAAGEVQIAELYAPIDGEFVINETVVDSEFQVTFVLNYVYSVFEALLAFSGSFMMSPTSTPVDRIMNVGMDMLFGTGPYTYSEYIADTSNTLEYWPYYWGGTPAIETIKFLLFDDATSRSQALLAGDIHMGSPMKEFNDQFNAANGTTHTVEIGPPGVTTGYLGMNNKQINVTWREVISYSIDYDYIINGYMEGTMIRMKSPIPAGILYSNYTGNVATLDVIYARNMILAMNPNNITGKYPTLAASDPDVVWRTIALNDPIATFNYTWNTGNSVRENIGIIIMDNLRDVGINVAPNGVIWADYLNMLYGIRGGSRDDLSLYFMGWMPDYNDPSNFINPLFNNLTSSSQVNDPTLEALMLAGIQTPNGPARKLIYDEIQELLVEELYSWAYIYTSKGRTTHDIELTNYPYNAMGYLYLFNCGWQGDTWSATYNTSAPPVISYEIPIVDTAPGVPTITTTTQTIAVDNIDLEWTASTDDLTAATSYIVYVDDVSEATPTGTTQNIVFAGNGTYVITVAGVNSVGESAKSESITITVAIPPDEVPAAPTITTTTQTIVDIDMDLVWTASEYADYYRVFVDGTEKGTTTATNLNVVFAVNGTYIVTVSAVNSFGESAKSESITITVAILPEVDPPDEVPAAPTITTTTQTIAVDNIDLVWTASEDADFYRVVVDGTEKGATTATTINLVFAGNGTYVLTVTAVNDAGESARSESITITVFILPEEQSTPQANFRADTTQIVVGKSVQFIDLTLGGNPPMSYQWNFGDGSSNSTERNPIHKYTSAGIYHVILTVTDNDGDISIKEGISINVTDNLLPNADFTTNATEIIVGQWVQFTDLTTGGNTPLNYQWNFGDGSAISTKSNPIHQYNTIGNYTVILTVTDADGDLDVIFKIGYIQVQDNPDPDPDPEPDPDPTGNFLNNILVWSFGIGGFGFVIGIIIFVFKKRGSKFTGDEPLFLN